MDNVLYDIPTASINSSLKLVGRQVKPEGTIINLNETRIGGEEFVVMAGPCAVENREQLMTTARYVKSGGAKVLRGGAFKPVLLPIVSRE